MMRVSLILFIGMLVGAGCRWVSNEDDQAAALGNAPSSESDDDGSQSDTETTSDTVTDITDVDTEGTATDTKWVPQNTAFDTDMWGCGGGGEELPDLTPETCSRLSGAYSLSADCDQGGGFWLLLTETDGQCEARVTPPYLPGSRFEVTGNETILSLSGGVSIEYRQDLVTYQTETWCRFDLDIDENGLVGTGETECSYSGQYADIGYSEHHIVGEAHVSSDNSQGRLRVSTFPIFPWSSIRIETSREVPYIAKGLLYTEGELVFDPESHSGAPMLRTSARLAVEWDTSRGNDYSFSVGPDLVDISGKPFAEVTHLIRVLDVGPAVDAHEFESLDGIYTWGDVTLIDASTSDRCEDLGCVALTPSCSSSPLGIAGQLLTGGNSEVVITMRPADGVSFPLDYGVSVVGEDGAYLRRIQGDSETELIVDVTGHERVGFEIWTTVLCYDYATGIVIDSIRTREAVDGGQSS